MIIQNELLVIVNSKGKVQKVKLWLEDDPTSIYYIKRITGQYGGKETEQPTLTIEKGKVKRTVLEQAQLQYNSLLKKYKDKGYVSLSDYTSTSYDELTANEIKNLIGVEATDQSGIVKPMLAKLADQCPKEIWDRNWYVSRKLDGTRCLMYYKDGEIHTASRGGGNYDTATTHLRNNKELKKIFDLNPDLILDGEIYRHGADWPLQRISGLVRQQEWNDECLNLQYWVYDVVDQRPFKDRWVTLQEIAKELSEDSNIKILDQKLMTGYELIKAEHDLYVQEGFEGLCARCPDVGYGVNKRSATHLVKLKERKDDEFEITGIRNGLRDEDMCFTLKTKDGKEFAAKPVGDIESRKYFLEHYKEFIGKMATCTYFSLSKDGVPTQPVLKSIRPADE